MYEFLSKNISYPKKASENKIDGTVVVKFTVDTDGTIKHAEVIKSVDPSIDAEALRVINSMPKWIPGKVNGRPVAVTMTERLKFKLDK